jgi:hypothetical protein
MTDRHNAIHDDIAFMRTLAEEGRKTPMIGGSVLLAAGLIFGGAELLGVALQSTGAPGSWAPPVGAMALFTVVLAALKRRAAALANAGSTANRATAAMWRAIGWSIMLLVAALALAASRLGDVRIMAAVPVVIFALYGAGWQVAAAVSRIGWLRGIAFGSYLAAFLTAGFAAQPLLANLITAGGLFALMAAPGYALMRQSGRAT